MQSLDSYGIQLLERLKTCSNEGDVWILLAEANEALHGSQLNLLTRRMFWQTFRANLETLSQDAPLLLHPEKLAALQTMLRIAKSEIQEFLQK